MNAALAIQLLLGLLDRATEISTLLNMAHAEGRDVTPEELDALVKKDEVAKAALEAAIKKAKGE